MDAKKGKKDINVEIGRNIQREREKAGYTQERFAEMINYGTKSLSAAERGTVGISFSVMRRICTVLSISSDAILFGETAHNNVQDLTGRLERLSPRQLEIAREVLIHLLEAFSLDGKTQETI